MLWLAAAAVATLWCLLALVWLAVLVPLAGRGPAQGQGQAQARQPTDDPRGEAPGPDSTTQTND
jgi:hypothetical protein